MTPPIDDRVILLGDGLPRIPERLLLAHARGGVVFLCGAGVSMPAGLPDFRQLVIDVYQELDPAVHAVIDGLPRDEFYQWKPDGSGLSDPQAAEVKRFVIGDYDVVLGMLERRLDGLTRDDSRLRRRVVTLLRAAGSQPAAIHRALMQLADRGGAVTIVTTDFDLLLEAAGRRLPGGPVETYSLGSIPRPARRRDFAGVFHIHGALEKKAHRFSELVLSDQDFGEFYLRRRVVPDFIYDAARLFNLVLVGYSANDPPMRYLLNAVAADGTRFDDVKERFVFFGTSKHDSVALEDWKARGITPVAYDSKNNHEVLCKTLERWAALSAVNGKSRVVHQEIRRIVKAPSAATSDADRDLFDHLVRRSDANQRIRLAGLASNAGADTGWLDAIVGIDAQKGPER